MVGLTWMPRLAASSSSKVWSSSFRVTYLRLILSPHYTFPSFSSSFTSFTSSPKFKASTGCSKHSLSSTSHQNLTSSPLCLCSAVLSSGSGLARSVVLVALVCAALSALEQLIGPGHARRGRLATLPGPSLLPTTKHNETGENLVLWRTDSFWRRLF